MENSNGDAPVIEQQLYSVDEAKVILRISRSKIYQQMSAPQPDGQPRLRSVKVGRTRRISVAAIQDYITLLEQEAEALFGEAA
ncbi:helix-turn-helix protein [Amycolatopsis sulphurea]|uniref:Helix-turn-helix protein n=2 Tax=Amycolatopsis sulphurea TaxID=76022 RepID=A0A2A9FZQ3_9PSEU|nr:helix-turn-helix protein [Amycolatopsis sulphurea]